MEHPIFNAKELGAVVSEARKAQDLTQSDLAGIAGTGRRFISDLEKGKETAQIGKILTILGALGVSITVSSKWR